jgi:hypothetical protein
VSAIHSIPVHVRTVTQRPASVIRSTVSNSAAAAGMYVRVLSPMRKLFSAGRRDDKWILFTVVGVAGNRRGCRECLFPSGYHGKLPRPTQFDAVLCVAITIHLPSALSASAPEHHFRSLQGNISSCASLCTETHQCGASGQRQCRGKSLLVQPEACTPRSWF